MIIAPLASVQVAGGHDPYILVALCHNHRKQAAGIAFSVVQESKFSFNRLLVNRNWVGQIAPAQLRLVRFYVLEYCARCGPIRTLSELLYMQCIYWKDPPRSHPGRRSAQTEVARYETVDVAPLFFVQQSRMKVRA